MYENIEELKNHIKDCKKCKLCTTRQNVVFGIGNEQADIMFIGEGPGGDEDRLGEPFVGKAGQLMNNAFDIVGIKRENVYIANIVDRHIIEILKRKKLKHVLIILEIKL